MKLIVVYNAKSGSALSVHDLRVLFRKASIDVEKYIDITQNSAGGSLKQYAKNGRKIAAIGGDGTIASVAGYVVNTPGILAPLPGGTLNHFTKDLGVDQDLSTAIQKLRSSKVTRVDTAKVNDVLFLNNSSIGIYPSSLRVRKQTEDTFGKWPAAVMGIVRALLRFQVYTVTLNGKQYKTPFLFVGNNEYTIENSLERTSLHEGMLAIYIVASTKRITLIKLLFGALAGRLENHTEFVSFQSKSVTIQTKRATKLSVSADGEIYSLKTPLSYKSQPKSLKIIGSS